MPILTFAILPQVTTVWCVFCSSVFTSKSQTVDVRVLETVHTASCIHFLYTYLILGFGDFAGFEEIVWCVIHRHALSIC